MRRLKYLAICFAAITVGCEDKDPCGIFGGGSCETAAPVLVEFMIGFPADWVDYSSEHPSGGYWGRLKVGQTFTLVVGRSLHGEPSTQYDTVKTVIWASPDASVLSVVNEAGGRGPSRLDLLVGCCRQETDEESCGRAPRTVPPSVESK